LIYVLLRRSAKGLAYLLASVVLGPFTFLWALITTLVSGVLSLTYLGLPVFLLVTWVTRQIATFERVRARLMGRSIAAPYVPTTGTVWARGRATASAPSTWRDLSWLVLLLPLGIAGFAGVFAAVFTAATIIAPIWLWAVPNPYLPPLLDYLFNTVPGRFILTVLGLLVAPLTLWFVRKVAGLQANVAEKLLAPGPRQRLVDRAETLAVTRRRVVDAQAAELKRIERDLHDGAQAGIVAAGMTLALAERRLRDNPARDDVRNARRQLDNALAELRRLVRGIHPPILTDRGLVAALAALAGDAPLPVDVQAEDLGDLPPAVESAAYFVVAEALANAVKHADANECVITLTLTQSDWLSVSVRDDGRGGANPGGSGLDGLRRRIEALDGTMTITSPLGGPTTVQAEFPCAS
jgi:signal transduction histidine kinase